MRSRNGGVDRSRRRPSEYSCRAPLGTQMPSRTNREFDWTTGADSGDLIVRSACRQSHLADTANRLGRARTRRPPDGSVSFVRLRIDQADGLAAGLTSGLSSGLVPGLVNVDGTGFSVGTALPAGLLHAPTNRAAATMSKASNGFMKVLWGFPDTLSRSHRREDPSRISVWAVPGLSLI